MKNLWTPWRLEHILGNVKRPKHCLFEPEKDSQFSKEELLLYNDAQTVVLLNRFPYANGHLLVAPVQHVSCLTKLKETQHNDLMLLVKQSADILKNCLSPDGFNIGCNIGSVAGAGIADHLHFYIVPRWDGDHNFITVVSEVRTIPEHIDTTFDKLLPYF